jgi:hypothetical protein
MDETLQQLIELASLRGNIYVKGASTLDELPGKLAELVFFCSKSQRSSSIPATTSSEKSS